MPGGTFLRGSRVSLRTIEEDDLAFLRDYKNDPRIRHALTHAYPENLETQHEWFEDRYDGDDVSLLACVDDEPVGYVALFRVDESAGHAELAYWITPDAQGNGYGTETVSLALDYAFDERRLHRVRGRALATNDASRTLLEKLGFVHEGVQRDEKYVRGEYVDVHCYGLLEDEWDGSEAI